MLKKQTFESYLYKKKIKHVASGKVFRSANELNIPPYDWSVHTVLAISRWS